RRRRSPPRSWPKTWRRARSPVDAAHGLYRARRHPPRGRRAARPLRAGDSAPQRHRHRGRLRGLARLFDLSRDRRHGMVRALEGRERGRGRHARPRLRPHRDLAPRLPDHHHRRTRRPDLPPPRRDPEFAERVTGARAPRPHLSPRSAGETPAVQGAYIPVMLPLADLDLPGNPADHRIVVAMSGGVDSSVVAALLTKAGYDVVGITLQLYDHGAATGRKGACCAGQDVRDAANVAECLGIPHYVLDYEARFRAAVIEDFADSYGRGETPIPCIRCNERVKFRDLLGTARDLGASALATG